MTNIISSIDTQNKSNYLFNYKVRPSQKNTRGCVDEDEGHKLRLSNLNRANKIYKIDTIFVKLPLNPAQFYGCIFLYCQILVLLK